MAISHYEIYLKMNRLIQIILLILVILSKPMSFPSNNKLINRMKNFKIPQLKITINLRN
jgi:hypothetical protein